MAGYAVKAVETQRLHSLDMVVFLQIIELTGDPI
jgi:hypothetical protein